MFSNAGAIAMHRWIPWISERSPFSRPNEGEPFVTASSPKVDVEIVTDEPMDLAAPAAEVVEVPAGAGRAWAFSVENVREVSLVLAPRFDLYRGEVEGHPDPGVHATGQLRRAAPAGTRRGGRSRRHADRLGVDYPWSVLSVVETEGGAAIASPALVWVPRTAHRP